MCLYNEILCRYIKEWSIVMYMYIYEIIFKRVIDKNKFVEYYI